MNLKFYEGKKRYAGFDGHLNTISCKLIGILSLNLAITDYDFSEALSGKDLCNKVPISQMSLK